MKPILVCLHGWGGSSESFSELRAALGGIDVEILTPNLPGFGGEPDPPEPWSVEDYADWVERWIRGKVPADRLSKGILLLGHSHGGRIAITVAVRKSLPVTRLYLCAAAGIKRPRHLKRIIGLTLAKAGKTLFALPGLSRLEPTGKKLLYRLVRVHDYEKANEVMRKTMIRVTAEDLRPLLQKITVPTELFWGTDDGMTPYEDGKIMEREIKGSRLHTYPGIRHAVHRERAREIAMAISATI